jgi:hypothetical protein
MGTKTRVVEGDEMRRKIAIGSVNEIEKKDEKGEDESIEREGDGDNKFFNTKWRLN